jgi:uncharacterized coiled-coil protein SlyX
VHTSSSWAKALAELNAVIAATSVAADKNKTIRRMMHHLRTFSGNAQCIAATGSNLFN